jgi:hypothetical protein
MAPESSPIVAAARLEQLDRSATRPEPVTPIPFDFALPLRVQPMWLAHVLDPTGSERSRRAAIPLRFPLERGRGGAPGPSGQ